MELSSKIAIGVAVAGLGFVAYKILVPPTFFIPDIGTSNGKLSGNFHFGSKASSFSSNDGTYLKTMWGWKLSAMGNNDNSVTFELSQFGKTPKKIFTSLPNKEGIVSQAGYFDYKTKQFRLNPWYLRIFQQ